MAKWEGPFENPHARLAQHPRVAAERVAARKRWRLRQTNRARETALAGEHDDDAGGDIASLAASSAE